MEIINANVTFTFTKKFIDHIQNMVYKGEALNQQKMTEQMMDTVKEWIEGGADDYIDCNIEISEFL